MSSKVKAIGKEIAKETAETETKNMTVRLDVKLVHEDVVKSAYIVITGIPKDLPAEYENTVLRTAEGQFAQALNSRKFLELYSEGKSARDEKPTFYNLDKVGAITVLNVSKVE